MDNAEEARNSIAIVQTAMESNNLFSAEEVSAQVQLIQKVMQAVMQEGYHYGVIPGTDKPTLLKPGAEKLAVTFRLAPLLHVESRDLPNEHREYQVRCTLVHIPTGKVYGEGVGCCSTMESRYRYRKAERVCPRCNKAAIIKGKAEYGGGWICFQRKDGCGAKFADQDTSIVGQSTDRVENKDLADVYNTVLKIAKKRGLIDSILTATAASDIFTQDLEDSEPEPHKVSQPNHPTEERKQSVPQAAPEERIATSERVITKGQHEILLLSQRRSRVSEHDFMKHVAETYHITDLKQLKQKDVNSLLGWLEAAHEAHEQKQAVQAENEQKPAEKPLRMEPKPESASAAPEVKKSPTATQWHDGMFKGEMRGDERKKEPHRVVIQTSKGENAFFFTVPPAPLKLEPDWSQFLNRSCKFRAVQTIENNRPQLTLLDIQF